jgi:hypothetical protein
LEFSFTTFKPKLSNIYPVERNWDTVWTEEHSDEYKATIFQIQFYADLLFSRIASASLSSWIEAK